MIRFICICMLAVFIGPISVAQAENQNTVIAAKKVRAEVHLLRGFGNVFSRGLDTMTTKLKTKGVPAKIMSHTSWQSVADSIIANRKRYGRRPIVLIGHSLGANAILKVADRLRKKRIRVDYMVTFAATAPMPVPSNVRKITNYYFKTDGWGKPILRGPGFRGNLKNIDFSKSKTVGHFNIDKQPRLQRQVINNVLRFVGLKRSAQNAAPKSKATTKG